MICRALGGTISASGNGRVKKIGGAIDPLASVSIARVTPALKAQSAKGLFLWELWIPRADFVRSVFLTPLLPGWPMCA
jgi:hypothetical protein